VAILCVTHPAAQTQLPGFAVDIPAKADALDAALNEVMTNHIGWTEVSVAEVERGCKAMKPLGVEPATPSPTLLNSSFYCAYVHAAGLSFHSFGSSGLTNSLLPS
jgi:hypothetical protein